MTWRHLTVDVMRVVITLAMPIFFCHNAWATGQSLVNRSSDSGSGSGSNTGSGSGNDLVDRTSSGGNAGATPGNNVGERTGGNDANNANNNSDNNNNKDNNLNPDGTPKSSFGDKASSVFNAAGGAAPMVFSAYQAFVCKKCTMQACAADPTVAGRCTMKCPNSAYFCSQYMNGGGGGGGGDDGSGSGYDDSSGV